MASTAPCPFCEIVAGRAAAAFVLEAPRVVAFVGLRQWVEGHVLVIPRRHVETLYDLEDDDAAAMLSAAVSIARAVRSEFKPEGLSLWQSNGPAAFQEVAHVHLHVQPRWTNDGLLNIYPGVPTDAPLTQREALAVRIRTGLAANQAESSA